MSVKSWGNALFVDILIGILFFESGYPSPKIVTFIVLESILIGLDINIVVELSKVRSAESSKKSLRWIYALGLVWMLFVMSYILFDCY